MKPLHSEFVRFQVLVPVHFYFSRREDNSEDSAIVLKYKWRQCQSGVGITSAPGLLVPCEQSGGGTWILLGTYLCRNLGYAGNSSTPHMWALEVPEKAAVPTLTWAIPTTTLSCSRCTRLPVPGHVWFIHTSTATVCPGLLSIWYPC